MWFVLLFLEIQHEYFNYKVFYLFCKDMLFWWLWDIINYTLYIQLVNWCPCAGWIITLLNCNRRHILWRQLPAIWEIHLKNVPNLLWLYPSLLEVFMSRYWLPHNVSLGKKESAPEKWFYVNIWFSVSTLPSEISNDLILSHQCACWNADFSGVAGDIDFYRFVCEFLPWFWVPEFSRMHL